MYAFCAICSGVVPRFLYPDYQERPLKMLDLSLIHISSEEMVEFANAYAAEHLIISMDNPWEVARRITAAGSVFRVVAGSPEIRVAVW